jgi:hypothetical protein
VQEKGLWFIARPGPYLYTEWVNLGIPTYAAKYHRFHPTYLKLAEKYMEQVSAILKPYLVTNGGKIILVQADNEIDPMVAWYADQLGLGKAPGIFQEFLKKKYKTISRLNGVWKTKYRKFEEAQAIMQLVMDEPVYRIRYLDFCEFRYWYANQIVLWAVRKYQRLGINVPIYLNTYPAPDIQNWSEFQNLVPLVGIDTYPSNEFNASPTEHRDYMRMAKYAKAVLTFPYIAEFGSGVWHGHHYYSGVLTNKHYRLLVHTALASGIKGWNWYMLVNRDNWYFSPINEWGRKRGELYIEFSELVKLYQDLNIPDLEKLTDTAMTFDMQQFLARNQDKPDSEKVWNVLYQGDIDFELYDLMQNKINKPLLFYAGQQWLSRKSQQNLVAFVKQGGTLIMFTNYPRSDEFGKSLNLLEIKDPERIYHGGEIKLELGFAPQNKYTFYPNIFFDYQNVPGKKLVATQIPILYSQQEESDYHRSLRVENKYTIGYIKRVGRGRLIVLGIEPSPELISRLHQWLRIPVYSQALTAGIQTAIFRKDDGYCLFIISSQNEPKNVTVALSAGLFKKPKYSVQDWYHPNQQQNVVTKSNPLVSIALESKQSTVVILR